MAISSAGKSCSSSWLAHLAAMIRLHFFFVVVLALLVLVHAVPPDFVDEEVMSFQGIGFPTDIAHFIDNENNNQLVILVTIKDGYLYAVTNIDADNPSSSPPQRILVADLTDQVCDNRERGLQSVAVHPNFATNRYVYLSYTWRGPSGSSTTLDCDADSSAFAVGRLVRYRLTQDYALTDETPLLQTSLAGSNHNGGKIAFGPADGYVYMTTGDGGRAAQSQDATNLMGKVLRVTDDGNIPDTNPYTVASGYAAGDSVRCAETGSSGTAGVVCQEIFSLGLRNPFQFAMDTRTSRTDTDKTILWIMDVGAGTWEEINECGTDYAGANYGWPEREGPCATGGNQGNNVEDCNLPPTEQQFAEPAYWYLHDNVGNMGNTGASITGGDFVPLEAGWPSEYQDAFVFGDYVFDKIYYLFRDPDRACRPGDVSCDRLPVPGFRNATFHEFARPLAMRFFPYQNSAGRASMALYYCGVGEGSSLKRISYQGGDGTMPNSSPEARIVVNTPNDIAVVAPQTDIQFDASGTTDADSDDLTFDWDFGDGSPLVSTAEVVVTHSYALPGTFRVQLTARDGNGGRGEAFADILVGTPPVVTISSPPEGTTFAVGDFFVLSGTAIDGVTGASLSDDVLNWEVRQHHDDHFHPFLDAQGNNVSLGPAPEPEDFLASENSYLEVILSATDSDGLSTSTTRNITPKGVELLFDTIPPGFPLRVYDFVLAQTPETVLAWENQAILAEALDVEGYEFVSWSDGGAQAHFITIPPAAIDNRAHEFVASYRIVATEGPTDNTRRPTSMPTLRPTTDVPTHPPTGEPTSTPMTMPTNPPADTPATDFLTSSPTRTPTTDMPTNQPTGPSIQGPSTATSTPSTTSPVKAGENTTSIPSMASARTRVPTFPFLLLFVSVTFFF